VPSKPGYEALSQAKPGRQTEVTWRPPSPGPSSNSPPPLPPAPAVQALETRLLVAAFPARYGRQIWSNNPAADKEIRLPTGVAGIDMGNNGTSEAGWTIEAVSAHSKLK